MKLFQWVRASLLNGKFFELHKRVCVTTGHFHILSCASVIRITSSWSSSHLAVEAASDDQNNSQASHRGESPVKLACYSH
jgi:hypothetical protein